MKLLILSWELYPVFLGGLGVLARSVVDELKAQGVEVTVLMPKINRNMDIEGVISLESSIKTLQKTKPKIPSLDFKLDDFPGHTSSKDISWTPLFSYKNDKKNIGINNLYPKNTPLITRLYAHAVLKFLQKSKISYDAILGMDWETLATMHLLKEEKIGIKFISYVNVTSIDSSPDKKIEEMLKNPITKFEQKYYAQSDHLICVSSITKNVLENVYKIDPKKITVVSNDVAFSPSPEIFPNLGKHKIVLFVGRVVAQKGLFFLIQTIEKVIASDPGIIFIIAGDGDLMPQVIDKVAEKSLSSNVFFTGWSNLEEKKLLYASSSLFIMPSPSEPFGLTPLEAIRSNLPVISSKLCGFLDVVKSTPTFEYHDVSHFGKLILYYLNNEEERLKLLKQQQKDLAKHSWQKQVQKIIKLCKV